MTDRLIHFSNELLDRDSLVVRDQDNFKPRGLWFSCEGGREDGWADWCVSERFRTEDLVCATEVFLRPDARTLHMSTHAEILEFTSEYATCRHRIHLREIDWSRVAKDWQVVMITPYVWSARMDMRCWWYYSWDVASGCVIDPAAIDRLEPVEWAVPVQNREAAE